MMHPGSPGLLQTIIGGLLNVAASYVGRTQIGDTIISGLSSVSNVGNPTLSDIGNPDINITNSPRFMQRVNNSLSDIGNPTVTNWNQLQSTLQNMNVTQLKAFMQAFGGSASASASAAAAAAAAAAAGGG
jgi:hypothetical protein